MSKNHADKNGNKPRIGGYRNLWRERLAKRRAEAEARQIAYNARVDQGIADRMGQPASLSIFLDTLSPSQLARCASAVA